MANDRSVTVKGCTFKRMLVLVRAASLHCQSRPPCRANDNAGSPSVLARYVAGEDKVPPGAADELLRRARCFVSGSSGPTEVSGDLFAKHLTDWLIKLAWDAVETATAESTAAVSGKAQYRLVARLLCDACGHEGPVLDNVEVFGKQLGLDSC